MTPKEKQLKDFIALYWEENGYAPSFREMKDGIGCSSTSEIDRLVSGLEAGGHVQTIPGKKRSIKVTEPNTRTDITEELAVQLEFLVRILRVMELRCYDVDNDRFVTISPPVKEARATLSKYRGEDLK